MASKACANGSPPSRERVCLCVCMWYVVSTVDEGVVAYSIATEHRAIE